MDEEDINEIINFCREFAQQEMPWVNRVVNIPEIFVDFRPSNYAFLGRNNPAIMVNEKTFRLTKAARAAEEHTGPTWVPNQTLVISENVISPDTSLSPVTSLGIIIHETGHAYNVAANIHNSEGNAYLFEITTLLQLFDTKHTLAASLQNQDLTAYFKERMPQYRSEADRNAPLAECVAQLEKRFNLSQVLEVPATKDKFLVTSDRNTLFSPEKKRSVPDENAEVNDLTVSVTNPPLDIKVK